MSETQKTKEQLLQMAAGDLEQFLHIVGELGFKGYKVCLCRLHGKSLQQCAKKHGVSVMFVRWAWEKCQANGYDAVLKNLFHIESNVGLSK